jgi:hypothetical protein
MPPSAMVPIAALLIGYDETMKVAVVTFAAIWPVLLNARAGVRALDPVLLDTARSLHLRWFDTSRKCLVPALMPAILLGVRVAAPVSLVITLTTGVVILYLGLFTLSLVGEAMLLRAGVLGEALRHPVGWTDYTTIAWLASSMATVGGAIGSGLDSDEAARHAAFGSRQRERNADQREESGDEGSRGDRLR